MTYQLSLLDKSPIPPGATAVQALANTVRLAQRAEVLGYHRFWLAEHHQSPTLAGAAPELLVAYLLAQTRHIRIGSGGVMLQHYSPYKVAELFKLLAALAPGRVDLGVGKAPGGLPLSTRALQARHDLSCETSFEALLSDLDNFLHDTLPAGHGLQGAVATPQPPELPQRVLLGGSPASALLAAQHGWQFCYAGHFNSDPENITRSVAAYRGATGRSPLLALCAFAADTAQAAARAVGALKLIRLHLPHPHTGAWEGGQSVNLPSLEAAAEFARQAGARDYRTEEKRPQVIAGSSAQVRAELQSLSQRWGIKEFVIDIPVPGFAERQRAVELLAAATTDPVHHAAQTADTAITELHTA